MKVHSLKKSFHSFLLVTGFAFLPGSELLQTNRETLPTWLPQLHLNATAFGDPSSSDFSSVFDTTWPTIGYVLGFGDHQAYVKYICNGIDRGAGVDCDGPPEEGVLNRVLSIADSVIVGLGYAKCSDIPTSGNKTVTAIDPARKVSNKVAVTFATPKLKIAGAWLGGETPYDRRLEYTATMANSEVKMNLEISCQFKNTAHVAVTMPAGWSDPKVKRRINVIMGTNTTEQRLADIYVSEAETAGHGIHAGYGFAVNIDDTSHTYSVWGAATNKYTGVPAGATPNAFVDTYNLVGDFKNRDISILVKRFAGSLAGGNDNSTIFDDASFAVNGSDDASLAPVDDYSLLSPITGLTLATNISKQGCMNFKSPSSGPSSPRPCAGLNWAAAPRRPVIDGKGTFSTHWLVSEMNQKLEDIPTP